MHVIVMLDDANGMMFNNRRQSKDCVLRKDVLSDTRNAKLFMNEYSFKQFEEDATNIIVDNSFLEIAGMNDYCFVENEHLNDFLDKICTITIYRWNRMYPSDFIFDIAINEDEWTLKLSSEFEGKSHKKITKEVWCKNE